MNIEKIMQEYLETVEEIGKLSKFKQFIEMPHRLMTFFTRIYESGYAEGLKEGQKIKEINQGKQN